jgi:hypothetical protein
MNREELPAGLRAVVEGLNGSSASVAHEVLGALHAARDGREFARLAQAGLWALVGECAVVVGRLKDAEETGRAGVERERQKEEGVSARSITPLRWWVALTRPAN